MISGQFKNNDGKLYTVFIKKNGDNTEKVIGEDGLFFADNPIEIETSIEDTFTPIIKRSLTLNLISTEYLGNYFFGVNERDYAKKNLTYFSSICDEKDIIIFDRGYPSRDMIAAITGMGCKYLMRLPDSSFKGVKENPSNDFRITVSTKTDTYSVRVVRVILKSGEVETLITNLSEDEFSADDFLDLYFLRWGIETTYDTLKNKLLIEKFAGRSHVAVLQEYYAMMFVLNCIAAMSATVNRKLVSSKADCKYRYRANVNLMIGYFKYRLSAMLLFAENALDICRQLILLCLKQPVPIIKGRSAPRPEFSHQRKVFCPKYSI